MGERIMGQTNENRTWGLGCQGLVLLRVATSTWRVRMGECMMGPRPAWMSNGMFMPVRGVRMSENRITPSGLKACHGCSDTSTCAEGRSIQLHIKRWNYNSAAFYGFGFFGKVSFPDPLGTLQYEQEDLFRLCMPHPYSHLTLTTELYDKCL